MALLELKNISKTFQDTGGHSVTAVHQLSLVISSGELLVLAGPSGCGKTTTLRLIAGLEEPSGGEISLDRRSVSRLPPAQRDIAFVFQNPALYPHMTARDNLAFGLKVRNLPAPEINARVSEVTDLLQLGNCLNRQPHQLSGGECQRVALGKAIVRRPKVLLLDEPLSNLDAPMRFGLRMEIARLQQRLSLTMIYVTHDQVEAMTLGSRIALLRNGSLQQVAAPEEIYRQPANRFVAQFFGSPPINLLPGILRKQDQRYIFETAGVGLPLNGPGASVHASVCGRQTILGLRPEVISLHSQPSDPQTPSATVEFVHQLGPETHLHLGFADTKLIARTTPADFTRKPGDVLFIRVPAEPLLFFDSDTGNRLQ